LYLGVLGQRPPSRVSSCQVQPLAPVNQIKRQVMVKSRERRFINAAQACHRKSQSEHFSPSSRYRYELQFK
jgi:hypothetical protein